MENFKEQLFSNWYPMRWFMLVLALGFGTHYVMVQSTISGLLSLVILFQTITNSGCLLGQCKPAQSYSAQSDLELGDITFEEIKTEQ